MGCRRKAILAEIVGIMIGNGCIHLERGRRRYHVSVSSSKDEMSHQNYIKSLFEGYFNYKFRIAEEKDNRLKLINTSFYVGDYLIRSGLKSGSKIRNRATIPSWILEDNGFLLRAVRGIFDTDGCVYRKYGRYAQVQFKFGCLKTTTSVYNAMGVLGFSPTRITKDRPGWKFYVSRQSEIDRFFKMVGPMNCKHARRYNSIRDGDATI